MLFQRLTAVSRLLPVLAVVGASAFGPTALGGEAKPAQTEAAAAGRVAAPAVFKTRDSVVFPADGVVRDAVQAAALKSVQWKPGAFEVASRAAPKDALCDAVVTFDSPLPSGDAGRDRVVLHWHKARGKDGKPLTVPAPAVLALAPLSPSLMATSDRMADRLAAKGFHAFAFALPGAGPRHADEQPMEFIEIAAHPEQAVADLRRARDAVAALPGVDGKVGVEALCFGALAAIPAQSIDNAFDGAVIGFVGGDLNAFFGTLQGGMFRLALLQSGWSDADVRALAARTDPCRAASRIDAGKFHFYSFGDDGVWPPVCTDKLLKALALPEAGRTRFEGTHMEMFDKLGILEKRLRKMLKPQPAAASPPPSAAPSSSSSGK